MQNKDVAILAARYADEKKAEDIKVIDLKGLSSLCEYIVIATVTSKPHMEAVEEEISTRLKTEGVYKVNRDGGDSAVWRVSDYGAFLVHIMTQQTRDFYALDKIFSFGDVLDYKKPKPVKKTSAKKSSSKKTAPKKTTVKKTSAKKTAAKKISAKKPATKKTTLKTAKKASK